MKPIIFNTEMVKSILDDRKTQFRIPIKLKDNTLTYTGYIVNSTDKKRCGKCSFGLNKEQDLEYVKPPYKVDDVLYIKETFALVNGGQYIFKADDNEKKYESVDLNIKWISAVHLTEIESRIFLKVTNVRVEKIQDISMQDVLKEGVSMQGNPDRHLLDTKSDWVENWNSTAKDRYKWEDNPYVFVYEFERINKED